MYTCFFEECWTCLQNLVENPTQTCVECGVEAALSWKGADLDSVHVVLKWRCCPYKPSWGPAVPQGDEGFAPSPCLCPELWQCCLTALPQFGEPIAPSRLLDKIHEFSSCHLDKAVFTCVLYTVLLLLLWSLIDKKTNVFNCNFLFQRFCASSTDLAMELLICHHLSLFLLCSLDFSIASLCFKTSF